MVTFHGTPPTHLTVAPLEAAGVRHAFTTRHHGNLAGRAQRPFGEANAAGAALGALGFHGPAVRYARQVHGTTCLMVDSAPPGLVGEADALCATTPGLPLAVFTADCLAIVAVDPDRRALAVAHAGWRGTVAGLARRLVEALVRDAGAHAARLRVAIGPSIGPCCYEVDAPVIDPLRAAFPVDWTRWAQPKAPGKWWLDLWQANADQLIAVGVPPEAIANPRLCTACRPDLFFSYRREGRGRSLVTLACLD